MRPARRVPRAERRSEVRPEIAKRLQDALPPEAVLDDPLQLSLYRYDGTIYEGRPELVVLPETAEQVAAVAKACHAAGVPLVPRGAATSLSGGPVAVNGGVVVAFTRMDRVLEVDYPNQRAVVQPGVINLDLQGALSGHGYFFAPDPASQTVCTLGGNVGENSGGPHCLKYGVTANHVLGVEMVLSDGRRMSLDGDTPDASGYDLMGVVVGSEGTLGLVTQITCRIMPLPETAVTMLAVFDSLGAASKAVSDIIAAGIIPATLEMMDKAMIAAVEEALQAGYPLDAEAVLIIELDGLAASMDRQVERLRETCARNAVRSFQVAQNEEQRALLWKGRKGAFGAVVNIAPSKLCTDISVPRTALPEVLAEVMEIGRKWGIPIANVFHAGDGNLHPLVLYDPRDQDQVRRVAAIDEEITRLAIARGGVLTGEHGIGCGKRKYMPLMFGPAELRLMWRVRESFDPDLLCNPGKVLPDRESIPESDQLPLSEGGFLETVQEIARRDERGWLAPVDEKEMQTLLALAHREGQPLVLRGAGTKSAECPEGAVVVSTQRLDRILHYDHENLTITAQCGVTLPQIEEAVAPRGQMLALRPRFGRQATLGGIIAANESGPHRLLYGGPRDLVTRIRAALPNGEIVAFGSSCVKNVAGYAIEKLFIGSHGSLGVILEATLRTLPRPEALRALALPVEDPSAAAPMLRDLLASAWRPAAVELLNPPAARILVGPDSRWWLVVGLEGFVEDVDEITRRLETMGAEYGLGEWRKLDRDYFTLWSEVTDLGSRPGEGGMLRTSCRLSAATALAARIDALDGEVALRAAPGLGLVHSLAPTDLDPDEHYRSAQLLAEEEGGISAWLAPRRSGPAAPQGVSREICRRLKDAFDPRRVLPDTLLREEGRTPNVQG